jgi:hypothetical protein
MSTPTRHNTDCPMNPVNFLQHALEAIRLTLADEHGADSASAASLLSMLESASVRPHWWSVTLGEVAERTAQLRREVDECTCGAAR